MRRVVTVMLATIWLAGCASQPADTGPLTPIGDVPQSGNDTTPTFGHHGFGSSTPGLGIGTDGGPGAPGGGL